MSADSAPLIECLEDAMRNIREESARHWIRAAIRHLAEGTQPRRLAAASSCLAEAARCTASPDYRNWLRSVASHIEREAWS